MLNRDEQNERHRQAIIDYYQTGNEGALHQVFADMRPRISRFLSSRGLFRTEQIQDLVQETLAHVLLSLRKHQFNTSAKVGAWVMAIAWHRVAKSLRYNKWKPSQPGFHEDPFLLIGDAGTAAAEELLVNDEDEVLATQLLTAATKAVLGLDVNARAAVLLHFYQGLPVPDAAAKLGVAEVKFRERLNRGLAVLRDWAATVPHPSSEVYAALRRVNTGGLFQEAPLPGWIAERTKNKWTTQAT